MFLGFCVWPTLETDVEERDRKRGEKRKGKCVGERMRKPKGRLSILHYVLEKAKRE